jgi:DNA uptake protein ComE-like DNA-binding protein
MRSVAVLIALLAGPVASAKEATAVAADPNLDIRVVGRVNVNQAERAELLKVPGIDAALADALIARRADAPLRDAAELAALGLPEAALVHVKTYGESNLCRIVLHPLQRLDVPAAAAPAPATATR